VATQVRCIMERSLLQARLGALSHQQSESHLKAVTRVETQVTVKTKAQTTQLLVMQGKRRDTEESLNMARE
jgi:hypothetical protein